MPCKLVIKNKKLSSLLKKEVFDTYVEFERSLPVGREVYIKDGDTLFKAILSGFSFTGNKLGASIISMYGKGSTSIEDIVGFVDEVPFSEVESSLDPMSRVIDPNLPPPSTGPDMEAKVSGEGDTEADLKFDEEASRVAYKGFQKTTGQDVKSEERGELKGDPATLERIKLKAEIARDKSRFRYFIMPAGEDEALWVIDKALHDSEVLRLGRPLTEGEIKTISSPYTLPLEGKSPLDTSGEEDSFFLRNHDRRLEIAQEKLGMDPDEAEEFYRQGQSEMKLARLEARSAPREVKVKEATNGNYTKKGLSGAEIEAKYGRPQFAKIDVADGKKKIGFVIQGEERIELPANPKKITDVIPVKILEEAVQAQIDGNASREQTKLLESLFISKRNVGKINLSKGVLNFGTNPITSLDQFRLALKEDPTPSIYNKLGGVGFYTVIDGEIAPVTGDGFLNQFMESEGDLWTHNGTPVPYRSNQILYLDLSKGLPVAEKVPTTREQDKMNVEVVFDNYPYVATSTSKRSKLIRDLHPRMFTQRFRRTVFFKRLLAGTRPAPGPILVGGPFVQNITDLPKLIKDYVKGDVEMMQQGFPLERSVPYLSIYSQLEKIGKEIDSEGLDRILDTYARKIASETKQEIDRRVEVMLQESEAKGLTQNKLKLKRKAANDIANEIETAITFGVLNDEVGVSPTSDISYWENRSPRASLQSQVSGPYVPSPKIEALKTDSPYMTLDTYREYKTATGEWSQADEAEYQKEIEGQKSKLPTSIKLSNNGEETNFRVLVPSKITEQEAVVNREMLTKGKGIGLPSGNTVYLQDLKEVKGRANTQEALDLVILNSLQEIDIPMFSDEYLYAENILGKKLATSLLYKYPDLTFAEIERFSNYFGKTKISEVINEKFPTGYSSDKIKDGSKTITAREKGFNNPSGILEIEGEYFDVQFQGNLTFEEVGQRLGITLNEFLSRLTGNPEATTENITNEDMAKFLNGEGSRSIFTIRKLGTKTSDRNKNEIISCP